MSKSRSLKFGGISLGTKPRDTSPEVDPETPFRILVVGNFRGHKKDPIDSIAGRRPMLVDRDNLDEVLAKFGPEVHLPVAEDESARLVISFRELDSFHPDQLFQHLELFTALRDLHDRLENPKTFSSAAAEMRSWASASPNEPPASSTKAPAPPENLAKLSPENLLAQMLGEQPTQQESKPAPMGGSDWKQFLQKIVTPHLVKDIEPEQEQLLFQVDDAVSSQMQQLLHHPDFQALEAAWRGVDFLIRRLETGTDLKLYILHVTKEELAADLNREDLGSSGIYKLLVEETVETSGAVPWAAIVGNYTFERTGVDAQLLARMALIAAGAEAPFLAAAGSSLLGCRSLAESPDPRSWKIAEIPEVNEVWKELRKWPEAAYLGLALPRFLLRLPYGIDFSPTEQFQFEETPEGSGHEDYLWGNPAVLCACLLGQGFSARGWNMRPDTLSEVDGLPIHVYQYAGESHVKPCAEVQLTETALEAILDRGLIPLVSYRNRDVIHVARFQSLADPPTELAGRWQRPASR